MTLSWVMAVSVAVGAGLLLVVLIMLMRRLRDVKWDKHIQPDIIPKNSVEVTVYDYDSEVGGLDDIKAKHIGIYRDTGVITGIDDERPVYHESFIPTVDNNRELSKIVLSAAEVKRVTDKTMLYFFKKLRPIQIKSESIRILYNCISQRLESNRPVVLRMTRSAAGENTNE